jgi:hypothetical protein
MPCKINTVEGKKCEAIEGKSILDSALNIMSMIKKVQGGILSQYWFNQVKVNDLLRFEGPKGTFFSEVSRRKLPFSQRVQVLHRLRPYWISWMLSQIWRMIYIFLCIDGIVTKKTFFWRLNIKYKFGLSPCFISK